MIACLLIPGFELRAALRKGLPGAERVSVTQRAFTVFQLAQLLGWKPEHLFELSKEEWSKLVEEIEGFSATERRRIYHQAFERRYRNQTLDALIAHSRLMRPPQSIPNFQVVCCLDEREESFRRHLEEVAPQCETFGVAGFFGVAMYYRGVADALSARALKPAWLAASPGTLKNDATILPR